jgi:hypothetical protein
MEGMTVGRLLLTDTGGEGREAGGGKSDVSL